MPKFYWRQVSKKPVSYDVVDGQQRIRAICEFCDGKYGLPKDADAIDGFDVKGTLPEQCLPRTSRKSAMASIHRPARTLEQLKIDCGKKQFKQFEGVQVPCGEEPFRVADVDEVGASSQNRKNVRWARIVSRANVLRYGSLSRSWSFVPSVLFSSTEKV